MKALWIALGVMLAALPATTGAQGFDSVAPPPAPDYEQPGSWAARPDHPGAGAAVAPGATPAARKPAVDIFYVHPTTFRSVDAWNQDIADRATNDWIDESVIARQAGVFNGCCRLFAPRYRQAASRAVMLLDGEGGKAFALAYGDVERAFDAYIRNDNKGRPFILAGHSQGGSHIATLLARRIAGTPLAKQMVAAYAIGYNLAEGDFGKLYKHLPICDRPAQTGCVIGWNAVLPELDRLQTGKAMQSRYVKQFGDDAGKTGLCINPLTFDRRRPEADRTSSLGAAPGDPGKGAIAKLVPSSVSARCADGFLVVQPDARLALQPLPGGSMHFHDIGLFYADIRANAALRAKAFLKEHRR